MKKYFWCLSGDAHAGGDDSVFCFVRIPDGMRCRLTIVGAL
jgi:hypothetical protein